MWWDIAPEAKADFQHWHSHEHFPERLGVPGFQRATRWVDAAGLSGIFVLYELETYDVLSSPRYLARLNAPSPWSARMMPLHKNMVRAQCHVLASHGGAVASHAMTIRLSAPPGGPEGVAAQLARLTDGLASQPGIVGVHVLWHEPPRVPETTEQRIRRVPDRSTDIALVICGYDRQALVTLQRDALSRSTLTALGAAPEIESALYSLAHSAVSRDHADAEEGQSPARQPHEQGCRPAGS